MSETYHVGMLFLSATGGGSAALLQASSEAMAILGQAHDTETRMDRDAGKTGVKAACYAHTCCPQDVEDRLKARFGEGAVQRDDSVSSGLVPPPGASASGGHIGFRFQV